MVEITNSALAGALGPSMNSMLQQRYIILKDPALCRVVAVEGDSAISAIVRVIAIDTRTGAVDTFYTHCNFLQDAAELYRGTER